MDNSCWTCALRQAGGDTFLGLCRVFTPPKEIPPTRVDVGCKRWQAKPELPSEREVGEGGG